jgi:NADH dehydrogenase FAD-containing subunit
VLPVKPIENLYRGRRKILDFLEKKVPRIVVIGGGPAGVEICGNAARLSEERRAASITLLAGSCLLPRLPQRARRIALKSLYSRGVEVREGAKAARIEKDVIRLENGLRISYDVCFLAVGIKPPDLFVKSGLHTGEEGGLAVNTFLQSIRYPEIFGGGDCISFLPGPLEKVGVYAVRQSSVLQYNLLAALKKKTLTPFNPSRNYFLILNLGNGRGLFWWRSWAWDGKSAFFIKNCIDRRFMRMFHNKIV